MKKWILLLCISIGVFSISFNTQAQEDQNFSVSSQDSVGVEFWDFE